MEKSLGYQSPGDHRRETGNLLSRITGAVGRREQGMLGALLVMCAILYLSNHTFLSESNRVNTTRQIAMLGIFAIGSAFVIITGGIDLSVGSIVGLTGVIIAKISADPKIGGYGAPIGVGIAAALAIVLLIGLAQGLLITRLNLQPFIVTLGGMLAIRGISQTIVKGGTMGFGDSSFRDLSDGGLLSVENLSFGHSLPHWLARVINVFIDGQTIPYPVLIFAIVVIIGAYLLHFTVFGRYIYAIGGNRDAAAYSGIPVKKVECLTYVISAGLAGVAGVCYAAYIGEMSQNVGIAYELNAIAACVLGGCSLRGGEGTVFGVIIGSALMRVIENGLNMFRIGNWKPDENWRFIVIGAVILVAVILDQVVHLVQEQRRTRNAAALAAGAAHAQPVEGTTAPP